MSSSTERVTVKPSPSLRPNEYVPGIGAGKEMSREEAQPLLDAGLVVIAAEGGVVKKGQPVVVGDDESFVTKKESD